jgi:hypothetical protein
MKFRIREQKSLSGSLNFHSVPFRHKSLSFNF